MKNLMILTVLLLISSKVFAGKKVILTENLLKKMMGQNPPSVQQIEASFLSAEQAALAKKDAFGFRLEGEGQAYRSKEKLLNNSDGGVTRNSTSYSVGLVKPTSLGINVGVKAFGSKVTNAFISDAATSGIGVSLSLDLWKNFLGRMTGSDLKASELTAKQAKLEKKAALKTFESNLRKLYWALVANNEQKLLLTSLEGLAHKQYKQARKRNKSGVADSGEVARYRSQWATRKASLLSLRYRRGEILKSLKELLPDLNGKEVVLGSYSVDGTVQKVLACSATIRSHKKAPLKFTPYDEIVELAKQAESLELKAVKAYDDPDIKLIGEYASIGRDFGLDASRDNLNDNPRARTSLGLKVSIPFGGRKKSTMEVREKLIRNRYQAKVQGNLSKIKAFHSETADIISILKDVVKNQKETNKYLERSLKVSRRKYRQARISVQELISEQDSLLQSKLNEIDTNLTIINTLMDYFGIYTDTPCKLNRI